nr:hypothetical protein [Sphingobium sp.]
MSCGKNDDNPPAPRPRPAPETGAAAEVAKLDEGLRNGVLEKAIKASGALCPSVKTSERAEVRPGIRGWKAECDNGTAHLIEIQADGTANVTSRTY